MISEIVRGVIGPVTGLISEFVEDKDKANEIAYKISTMAASHAHANALGQLAVNKQEAAHKNLFVSGWRPAVGWVCVLALANNYLFMPYATAVGIDIQPIDDSSMMAVLIGMLGLGVTRTVEKVKGVARKS
jgi:hypothetical protein